MKNRIINVLQSLLGFETYLFFFARFIIRKLKWDKNEKDFLYLLDMIPSDGIVIDIGANIGIMTTHFSRKMKNGEVISFEPILENVKTLSRIIRHYKLKNVHVIESALGNEEGSITMIMPTINDARKQGLSHVKTDPNEEGEEYLVPINRLDQMDQILYLKQTVRAIKIDVEGFEYDVLQGAKETLLKHRPIIYCELWPNETRDKTITFLTSLNYNVFALIDGQLEPFLNQEKHNLFFVPEKQ